MLARARHLVATGLVLSTLQCGGEAAERDRGTGAVGSASPDGDVAAGAGGTPSAGNGGAPAGSGGMPPAGAAGGGNGGSGSGGFRNPCDPWPMTQACLAPEQITARAGSGSGGAQSGTAGQPSAGEAGTESGPPTTTNDCPELPPNSYLPPCVDGIGGPPTHVSAGLCCWTCRMVCG